MKKGFTILESIVIILVLGVLMAITVNAFTAITDARLKYELSKFTRMKEALLTYYSADNVLPAFIKDGSTQIDKTELITRGYLFEEDFKNGLDKPQQGQPQKSYILVACEQLPFQNNFNPTGGIKEFREGRDICVRGLEAERSQALTCSYEVYMDDRDTRNGLGRYSFKHNNGVKNENESFYSNCYKLLRKFSDGNDMLYYQIVLFAR